jgi:hypothetical protein
MKLRTEVGGFLIAAIAVAIALAISGCVVADEQDTTDDSEYVAGWSCGGLTGKTASPTGVYYTTSFGCWTDSSGVEHGDAGDNCVPYCMGRPGWNDLCAGLSGRECELATNWYAADSDRFGCFTRIRVENPDNGKAAVLAVIDRGPNCRIERQVSHWVLDMSYPASRYLFGGPTSARERADVRVEVVADDTPLGPTTSEPPDPAEPDTTPCSVGGEEGECIDVQSTDCDGTVHVGYCPGPWNIRCCTP